MRELPILMNGAMVRAVLEGRKTVTRQLVNPAPYVQQVAGMYGGGMLCFPDRKKKGHGLIWPNAKADILAQAPYQVGDRWFVREAWQPGYDHDPDYERPEVSVIYKADNAELSVAAPSYELADEWDRRYSEDGDRPPRVRAPASMPKWAARVWLEVTAVRVERLQDITTEQIIAEGITSQLREHDAVVDLRQHFEALWDGLAKPGTAWADNPWVWVVEFRRLGQGEV